MQLSIIIINYKTPDLTSRCIESIYKSKIPFSFEIIVVDNDSQDDSKEIITLKYKNVKWIANDYNAGFGRANNLGITHSTKSLILLLNSDMLLETDTLEIAIDAFNSFPTTGVLGCKLLNENGTHQKSTYDYIGKPKGILKYNLIYDKLVNPKKGEIQAVMGSFFLTRKDIFEKVGGFDTDFFMYAEELELCNRIRQLGYNIVYTEECKAIHKHGGSSQGSSWSTKQSMASNALLYLKVGGIANYLLFLLLLKLNFITNFLLLWKMDSKYRKGFWQEWKYQLILIPVYLKIPFLYSQKKDSGKQFLKLN